MDASMNLPVTIQCDWTPDIENILESIRYNCVLLSQEHKKNYFRLIQTLKYFRLPIIIISGCNSIVSVGLQNYLSQAVISMTSCLLSLICGIVGSIEMYLAIEKSSQNELFAARNYYEISIDIFKTLKLSKNHRPIPAKEYLEKKYTDYLQLTTQTNLVTKKINDKLQDLHLPFGNINGSESADSFSGLLV